MVKKIIKDSVSNSFTLFHKTTFYLTIAVCCISYLIIGYGISKGNFYVLLGLYSLLFALFFYYLEYHKHTQIFNRLLFLGFVFRLLFLFATPILSDNCYRVIWDGLLLDNGYNPYLHIPTDLMSDAELIKIPLAHTLFERLNSKVMYTVLPPLTQYISYLIVALSPSTLMGKIVAYRLIIIFFELMILLFGTKLLEKLKISTSNILLYALNPFVIIEFSGNLHLEPIMLSFFLASIYFLVRSRVLFSSIMFGFSIAAKMFTGMFMPLFYRRLKPRKRIVLYSVIVVTLLFLFLPFIRLAAIQNYLDGLALFFQRFEYNASIYYLIKQITHWSNGGFNTGIFVPIILSLIFITIVLLSYLLKKKMWRKIIGGMLFVFSVYLFLSPVVYPWYVVVPFVLSIFTSYRFPLVWTYMVIFSYISYTTIPAKENLYFIFLEYAVVFSYMIYELVKHYKKEDAKYFSA